MQENKKLSENYILKKFSFFIKKKFSKRKKISKIFRVKKAKFTFLYLTMYNFFRMSYYDRSFGFFFGIIRDFRLGL